MNNKENFILRINDNNIEVVDNDISSSVAHNVGIEHINSDTKGNGDLRVLIYTNGLLMPLKINNWQIEPIVEVSYDWGSYNFILKLSDCNGVSIEHRGATSFGTQSSRNFIINVLRELFYTLKKIILNPDAKHWFASQRTTPASIKSIDSKDVIVIGGMYNKFSIMTQIPHNNQIYLIPILYNDIESIRLHVDEFIRYAKENTHTRYLVTNISGTHLSIQDIAPLFEKAVDIKQIYLPNEYWQILLDKLERSDV